MLEFPTKRLGKPESSQTNHRPKISRLSERAAAGKLLAALFGCVGECAGIASIKDISQLAERGRLAVSRIQAKPAQRRRAAIRGVRGVRQLAERLVSGCEIAERDFCGGDFWIYLCGVAFARVSAEI